MPTRAALHRPHVRVVTKKIKLNEGRDTLYMEPTSVFVDEQEWAVSKVSTEWEAGNLATITLTFPAAIEIEARA